MPSVAVLGAGISGLSAAHRLLDLARERRMPLDITVYESSGRAGGCVQTVREGNSLMELGADSVLINKPAARRLIDRLGIADEVVPMMQRGASVAWRGRLHRIPPEFRLFMPRSIPALVRSGLFSPLGLARAAAEPFVPPRRDGGDETLASFVRRRLGREVLERLAQPIVGGIYSADPERLSMQMALPQFLRFEREYGSLWNGVHAVTEPAEPPQLVSFRNGIGTIVQGLLRDVEPHLLLNRAVDGIRRIDGGWQVGANNTSRQHDAIVCALQSPVAARVLDGIDERIAGALRAIRCNSIATVNMIYASHAITLPAGSGFVVPFVEGADVCAATFASQKYPQRTDASHVLVRAFFGGAMQPQMLQLSDADLMSAAHKAMQQYAGAKQAPVRTVISRWRDTLPEYAVNHQSAVSSLFERVRAVPGLALAGCAYSGVGIPDCVASAEAAAESVFGYLTTAKGA